MGYVQPNTHSKKQFYKDIKESTSLIVAIPVWWRVQNNQWKG